MPFILPFIQVKIRTHKDRVTAMRKGAKRVATHPRRQARRDRAAARLAAK